MDFPAPLVEGRLIKRYKRFLADVELTDGTVITSHCPNPGSMMGLKEPGLRLWLSESPNPKRKLKYTWELLEVDGGLVGINTNHPNKIAYEAIKLNKINELSGYSDIRREVKYGKSSRIDILLEEGASACYVEIKNVHLRRVGALAEFPDSATARGAKHLEELGDMVAQGHRAVMLYLVQRTDCDSFELARDIDPGYAKAFDRARSRGVEMLCYGCDISLASITVSKPIPLKIDAKPTNTGS